MESPPVIPASFQRESILNGNPGEAGDKDGKGNDSAYRMTGKRKATGFPIKDVGKDRGDLRESRKEDVFSTFPNSFWHVGPG